MKMKSIKAIFRRGQQPSKIEGQNQEDLSRASSITNLNVDQKLNNSSKGAKPRKSASRERLDKLGDKRNEKKAVTKNNNKLELGEGGFPSVESLQEIELLQRQLQEMANEKTSLAIQLGEQKGHLSILQYEIEKLKNSQEESNIQLEQLTEENTALRNRLRDVAHSPLSDTEKQQLLFESHRHHSSAPASIATNLLDDSNGGDITACPTPEWDKHSSSNVSEVSVACLQDKINQMQETHYSTNEELQATLQELTDLQRQLTELQQENERLNEEKTLMFDSLCRQTERLKETRNEVESLKQLLYREKDDTDQFESAVEREQKLVDLLKSAQEEREALLVKQEQLSSELQEARANNIEQTDEINQFSERVKTLECTLDAKHAEHKLLDQELAQAKDQSSGRMIEINRLKDVLENARTKINELEQDRALSDKSELDELLDNARKEKDALESEVAHLKEQLAISKNEAEKLKEQVFVLQEECKVTRNNAKTTQSDLEYKCEKLLLEKNAVTEQLQQFQEAVNELQVQSQCQLEDKRQLSAVLSETQRNLSEAERKNLSLENEIAELKKLRQEENEEWEKFQNDLLTSVRVANDFKTEAQHDLQKMIIENKVYKERVKQLEAQVDKLKGGSQTTSSSNTPGKESLSVNVGSVMEGPTKRSKKLFDLDLKSSRDKSKPPEQYSSFPRRRSGNKTRKSKKEKTLSAEEESLLNTLQDKYKEIDPNIPDEDLDEEQKAVRKLKVLFEDDTLSQKPVALKPKSQLAISKPLLDSVYSNPKLEEIVKNPKFKSLDTPKTPQNFEETIPEEDKIVYRLHRVESEDFGRLRQGQKNKKKKLNRSKSFDDLLSDLSNKMGLQRTIDSEDLTKDHETSYYKPWQRISSLQPGDSVSNIIPVEIIENLEAREVEYRKKHQPKLRKKSTVTFENLDDIVNSIPPNAKDEELTKEQLFARKLKKALDKAGRKNTLKKLPTRPKNLKIGAPTPDSVKRNTNLRGILQNPVIKNVKSEEQPVVHRKSRKISRKTIEQLKKRYSLDTNKAIEDVPNRSVSYNDINFEFYPWTTAILKKEEHKNTKIHRSLDNSDSLTSGELNLDTGETGPFNRRLSPTTKYLGSPCTLEKNGFEFVEDDTPTEDRRSFVPNSDGRYLAPPLRSFSREVLTDENVRQEPEGEDTEEKTYYVKKSVENEDKLEVDGKLEVAITRFSSFRKKFDDKINECSSGDISPSSPVPKSKNLKNLTVDTSGVDSTPKNLQIVEDFFVSPQYAAVENISRDSTISSEDNYWETFEDEDLEAFQEEVADAAREQKYGVVAPASIRTSYKQVVKEIKQKYNIKDEEKHSENEESSCEEENTEDFLDSFFGTKKNNNVVHDKEACFVKVETPEDKKIRNVRIRSKPQPDSEGKVIEIVVTDYSVKDKKFLMRNKAEPEVFYSVSKTESNDDNEPAEDKLMKKDEEAKIKSSKIGLVEESGQRLEYMKEESLIYGVQNDKTDAKWVDKSIIEAKHSSVKGEDNSVEKANLTKNNEEMFADGSKNEEIYFKSVEIYPQDKEEYYGVKQRNEALVHDSKNEENVLDNNAIELDTSTKGMEFVDKFEDHKAEEDNLSLDENMKQATIKDKVNKNYESLTQMEKDLINSVKKDRFSRPLSDINVQDLVLLQELTRRYSEENEPDGEISQPVKNVEDTNTNIQEIEIKEETVIPEIEEISQIFDKIFQDTTNEDDLSLEISAGHSKNLEDTEEDIKKVELPEKSAVLKTEEESTIFLELIAEEHLQAGEEITEDSNGRPRHVSINESGFEEVNLNSGIHEENHTALEESKDFSVSGTKEQDKFKILLEKYKPKSRPTEIIQDTHSSVKSKTQIYENLDSSFMARTQSLTRRRSKGKSDDDNPSKRFSLIENYKYEPVYPKYEPIYANTGFALSRSVRERFKLSEKIPKATPRKVIGSDFDNVELDNVQKSSKMNNLAENFRESTSSFEEGEKIIHAPKDVPASC